MKKQGQIQKIPLPIIRALVEVYYDFQHQRIITSNRILMNVERNDIKEEDLDRYGVTNLLSDAEGFEIKIRKILEGEIQNHEIYSKYLSRIYGIGPIISSGLMAYINDISKFDNISKLWQYFGFGMNTFCPECETPTFVLKPYKNKEGKKTNAKKLKPFTKCPVCNNETVPIIQRRTQGYMSNWNDKAKVLAWKIGQSFEKQGKKSAYYNLYIKIKEEERRNHPDKEKKDGKTFYNDGHIRNRALRKTIKIFLAHMYITWRKLENLEVTEPYVKTILGHAVLNPITDRK